MGQENDSKDLRQALFELAKNPGEATYRALYTRIIGHPRYEPYSRDLKRLGALSGEKRYAEVLQLFREMMPNWMLSPSAHQIACLAARHGGDDKTAALEFQIAESCLRGILASGDGSRERPYPVTHVEDEYDVLRHLGKQFQKQSSIAEKGRDLDCMACADGSEVWFDITPLMAHMEQVMRKG